MPVLSLSIEWSIVFLNYSDSVVFLRKKSKYNVLNHQFFFKLFYIAVLDQLIASNNLYTVSSETIYFVELFTEMVWRPMQIISWIILWYIVSLINWLLIYPSGFILYKMDISACEKKWTDQGCALLMHSIAVCGRRHLFI